MSEWLRDNVPGLAVEQSASQSSLKNQFKRADRRRARFAIVLGQQELDQGSLTLKPLRVSPSSNQQSDKQVTESREKIAQRLRSATPVS